MKRLVNDPILKRQLLSRYLWPGLGLDCGPDDPLTIDFAALSQQYEAVKYEDISQPGSFVEGKALWSERSLLHAYFYCTETFRNRGLRIFRRHQLIVETESLLYKGERTEYLQTLERGGLMGISYSDLRSLMKIHPPLNEAMLRLHRESEHYYHALNQYLLKPPLTRFREFAERHREVISRIPHAIRSAHIHVSETEYYRLLKKYGK